MTRVAAIDLGTNSTRLLVADVDGDQVEEVVRRSVVTRLGHGVDARRSLHPDAMGRVFVVLSGYCEEIDELVATRTLAVATSAVRDAENGPAFLEELEQTFGFVTRLLSGEEEAELTTRGVGPVERGTLLLDVGGGSTELVLGDFRTSIDIGSVRLTERFLRDDPPTQAQLDEAARYVTGVLPGLDVRAAIGVAGTVSQLHDLIGELTTPAVEAEVDRLAALPEAERALLPRMDPARAPVVVGGALIVREVLRRYGLAEIGYSRRELLDGAAMDAALLP